MRRVFSMLFALLAVFFAVSMALAERGGVTIIDDGKECSAGLPLKGIKIGIDPGHQQTPNNEKETVAPGSKEKKAKVASGTRGVVTGIPEYRLTLEVSLKLRDVLAALGAEVLMARETDDVDISNQERALMMNEWGADIVLRIHANGSTDASVNGIGTYVRATGACAQESFALAESLLNCMVRETGARRQHVYKRDTYTGLNYLTMPGVLVEMGYMTNREEDQKLNDADYQDRLIAGIVNGVLEYFAAVQ